MEARIGFAAGSKGRGVGRRVCTGYPEVSSLVLRSLGSLGSVSTEDTAVVSPEVRVPLGLSGTVPTVDSAGESVGDDGDEELESRQKDSLLVVGEVGVDSTGFGRTRTTLAPVQASLRAVKQASPVFHSISARASLLRFALRASSVALTVDPTASGVSKRYAKGETGSSSDISESHSVRGRK